jgi:hypothetical protein
VTVTQLPRWRTVPAAAKEAGVSPWMRIGPQQRGEFAGMGCGTTGIPQPQRCPTFRARGGANALLSRPQARTRVGWILMRSLEKPGRGGSALVMASA